MSRDVFKGIYKNTMQPMNEKSKYLRLMGIAQWVRRTPDGTVDEMQTTASALAAPVTQQTSVSSFEAIHIEQKPLSQDMGVDGSITLETSESNNGKFSRSGASYNVGNSIDKSKDNAWFDLKSSVSHCQSCGLYETRTQTIFGAGDEKADWLIIGDAPDVDEDQLGEPFVGQVGKLFGNMLIAAGLQRDAIYITNIVKCGPPNKRDPSPEEVAHCEHFLNKQVALIQPKIILAVGRTAAQNLLKTDVPIGKLRGNRYTYDCTVFNNATSINASQGGVVIKSIPLVVTYHPAYLLRSPREKRKSWQDLKFAQSIMQTLESGTQIDERQP